MSELILSLRSSSPSPSVIFPLRSRIVTPSTTRSSICMPLSSPTTAKRAVSATAAVYDQKDRSAYYATRKSVKKQAQLCVLCADLAPASDPLPDRLHDDVEHRDEHDVQ